MSNLENTMENAFEHTPEAAVEAVEALAPTRLLSETWEAWTGEPEENGGDLETSPWYFLGFASVTIMLFTVAVWMVLYLIEPQLQMLPLWLERTVLMSAWCIWTAVDTVFLLIGVTVMTGRNFVPFLKGRHIALSAIIPWTVRVGKLFGLSRDRLANSILQTGNILTMVNLKDIKRDELLILLPRCLDKATHERIRLVTSKYNVEFHICSGTQSANQLLAEKTPRGVIAVACERDLMAGVQAMKTDVPVIAIANKRPAGPCLDTHINMTDMENAIRLYLGKSPLPVKS